MIDAGDGDDFEQTLSLIIHRDVLRAPLRDLDVQVDERRTEEAAADAHGDEDGNLPKVPPIILRVIRLAIRVQTKVAVRAEPRAREITCVEI